MAFFSASTHTCRPAFFGPYRHLLGVRAGGWSACFEECMVASASALEFEKLVEEDLGSVSASVGDLIATDPGDMAIKSWDFGPSSITDEAVAEMLKESCFPSSRVKIPPPG